MLIPSKLSRGRFTPVIQGINACWWRDPSGLVCVQPQDAFPQRQAQKLASLPRQAGGQQARAETA